MSEVPRHTFTRANKRKFKKQQEITVDMPRRASPSVRVALVTARNPVLRGRVSGTARRLHGTISRGYTRRAGYYGRYNMGSDSAGELKFIDTTVDDAVFAASTITNNMTNIPQGVTESERVGRKCCLKSLAWRYRLNLPERDAGATPNGGDVIRLILYQDKQTNGATAAVTDIMSQTKVTGMFQLQNKGRFKILYNKTHVMNYGGMASDGAGVVSQAIVEQHHKVNLRLNIPMEFSGATGGLTEKRSNNVGLLALGTNLIMGMNGQMRFRFSDN